MHMEMEMEVESDGGRARQHEVKHHVLSLMQPALSSNLQPNDTL